ncbi:MAG TPA: hypothetical protein VGK99_18175 [Acidobacteriota bacterium]
MKRSEAFHYFGVGRTGVALHYPTVLTGDEPHYLVILNSLIEDFDLDLSNNYRQARAGDWDAGFWFRNFDLDLHAVPDAQGHLYTYHHGVAMPLILSAVCLPFRTTRWVEPLALLCSMGVVLLALHLSGKTLEAFGRPELAPGTILLAGLSTPLFAYARGLWTENFALLGFILVLWLWPKGDNAILIASVTAATILCRYPSAIVFVAIAVGGIVIGNRQSYAVMAGVAASLLFILGFNRFYYEQFRTPLRFESGNFFSGLGSVFFDPVHGLLPFAPILIFGLVGLARWVWVRRTETLPVLLSAAALSQIALTALYRQWHGGTCYSSRYLHTTLLTLALGALLHWNQSSSRIVRAGFVGALIYSLLLNLYAGFLPGAAVDRSPMQMAWRIWERIG